MFSFLLRYLCVQLWERLLRLQAHVDFAAQQHASSTQVVATFHAHYSNLRDDLAMAARRIAEAERLGTITSQATVGALLREISRCSRSFYDLHLMLSYVQGPWTSPEIETFIRSLCEDVASQLAAPPAVAVVPSDTYLFEEVNLAAHLAQVTGKPEGAATPTLFIPKVDASNPLLWPALIHEYAHTVHRRLPELTTMRTPAVKEGSSAQLRLQAWTEEIFCDLFAQHLAGPSYVAAFTDFVLCTAAIDQIEDESDTHPLARFRVTAMLEALNDDATVPFPSRLIADNPHSASVARLSYLLLEQRCELERLQIRSSGLRQRQLPDSAPFDLTAYRHEVLGLLNTFVPEGLRAHRFEPHTVDELSDRLHDRIPIGAVNQERRSALATQVSDSSDDIDREFAGAIPSPERVASALNAMRRCVTERPTTASEILNAGWRYKWSFIYRGAIENIHVFDDEREQQFRHDVFSLDELIRTSIETAYFGRLFAQFAPGGVI